MNTDDKNHQLKYFGWVTPSSIDEKNDQLKSILKEVGSLLHQLEQGNQLNLISQDNKENLLQLKEGIDGLIRDSFLPMEPKGSEPKIIPPDPPVWEDGVRKRRISYSQKQADLNLLSEKIESMQVRLVGNRELKTIPNGSKTSRGYFSRISTIRLSKIYMYIPTIVLLI